MLAAIDSQILSLTQTRNTKAGKVIDQIMAGNAIEHGQHTASLQVETLGAARVFHLMLDGRLIG